MPEKRLKIKPQNKVKILILSIPSYITKDTKKQENVSHNGKDGEAINRNNSRNDVDRLCR